MQYQIAGVDQELTAAGGTELTILCADTAATLDETLALLRGRGASIGGVRVVEPTLEDAFLAIAGLNVLYFETTQAKRALEIGAGDDTPRAFKIIGAVSVVSGHVRGSTNTLPLHIEALYNDYDFVGAFAAATLLAGLS